MATMVFSDLKVCVAGILVISVIASCSREKAYNVPRCATVWNGRFYDMHDGEAIVDILRKGDVQIERGNDGSECKLKVEWLDSCRYRLSYITCNRKQNEDLTPVIVQITAVKDDSYTIEGWVEGTDVRTYRSEIFRVK